MGDDKDKVRMIVREKERDNEKKRVKRVREKGRDVYKKDTVMKKL